MTFDTFDAEKMQAEVRASERLTGEDMSTRIGSGGPQGEKPCAHTKVAEGVCWECGQTVTKWIKPQPEKGEKPAEPFIECSVLNCECDFHDAPVHFEKDRKRISELEAQLAEANKTIEWLRSCNDTHTEQMRRKDERLAAQEKALKAADDIEPQLLDLIRRACGPCHHGFPRAERGGHERFACNAEDAWRALLAYRALRPEVGKPECGDGKPKPATWKG